MGFQCKMLSRSTEALGLGRRTRSMVKNLESEARYPGQTAGVLRLSQSSLERYLKCGLSYLLDRELKHRRCTVPMMIGSAVAWAAKKDNREKLKTGAKGLLLNQIIEAGVSFYEEEQEESEVMDAKSVVRKGLDETAKASRSFAMYVSPNVQDLIEAEQPIVANIAADLEIAGTPDYINRDGVGDLKTGRPWTQDRAAVSRQLTVYGILHRARHGVYPNRVWIDSLSSTRSGWLAQRLWSYRNPEDYLAMIDILKRAQDGIEKQSFQAPSEGAWYCSSKWCVHYWDCPAIIGRRKNNV